MKEVSIEVDAALVVMEAAAGKRICVVDVAKLRMIKMIIRTKVVPKLFINYKYKII